MSLVFFDHLSFTLALEAFSSLNYDCTDSLYCGFDCIEFFDIHELTKGVDLLFDCNITFAVLYEAEPENTDSGSEAENTASGSEPENTASGSELENTASGSENTDFSSEPEPESNQVTDLCH